jgi:2C-methyl-D-erythritol 2,4-cyclodiphosphate synthase
MEKYRDRLLRAHRARLGDVAYLAEVDAVLEAVEAGESDEPVPVSQLSLKGTTAAVVQAFEDYARSGQPPDVGGDVPGGGAV